MLSLSKCKLRGGGGGGEFSCIFYAVKFSVGGVKFVTVLDYYSIRLSAYIVIRL